MNKYWTEDQRLENVPYPIAPDFLRQIAYVSELIEADINFVDGYAGGSVIQIFAEVSKHGNREWDKVYLSPARISDFPTLETVQSIRAHFHGFQFALWVELPLPKVPDFGLVELQAEFYKQNNEAMAIRFRMEP